ncbi:MAG: hypothetical protein AB8G14_05650 [Ilumatobacter sp.]
MNIHAAGYSGFNPAAHQRPPAHDPQKLLAPAADLMGMSVAELQDAASNGTSLETVAGDRGISRVELVDALKDGLVAAKPDGAPSIEGTRRLDRLAESMASGTADGGRASTPPPPPPSDSTTTNGQLEALASLLDMSTNDLMESLVDGKSLDQLANDKGISFDSVKTQLERGIFVDLRA